jgi:hypothetical protein
MLHEASERRLAWLPAAQDSLLESASMRAVRKIFYNLAITGPSVAVALFIGTIELLGLLASELHHHGRWGRAPISTPLWRRSKWYLAKYRVTPPVPLECPTSRHLTTLSLSRALAAAAARRLR